MALEHLLAALKAAAETKVAAELDAAREEAARLEAEANRKLARLRAETLQARQDQLREETQRVVAAARREAREKLLLARHRLLDRVLGRALELAPEVARSPAYLLNLPDDLARALSYIGQSPAVVRCSAGLVPKLRPLLAEHGEWKLEVDPAQPAGFQVAARDSSVVVDRTLPRRLSLQEDRLRLEILQELGEP